MLVQKKKLLLSVFAVTTMLVISNCSKEENPIPQWPDPAINLIYPNGGESLLANTLVKIKWTVKDVSFVNIEFSSNNGTEWTEIADSIEAELGEWDWTIPDILSDGCKIKLTSKSNPSNTEQSDPTFSIYVDATLELLVPNGGEIWESRTEYSVKWTSENLDKVNITFTSDNGMNWDIVETSIPASLGEYKYETSYQPSDECRIRIVSAKYLQLYDESESNFTIVISQSIIEALKYYPLAIGNKWIYDATYITPVQIFETWDVYEVVDVQIEQEIKIFTIRFFSFPSTTFHYFVNVDTTSGIVTRTEPSGTYTFLDLTASVGDTIAHGSSNHPFVIFFYRNG
jgi:hypothetical protein